MVCIHVALLRCAPCVLACVVGRRDQLGVAHICVIGVPRFDSIRNMWPNVLQIPSGYRHAMICSISNFNFHITRKLPQEYLEYSNEMWNDVRTSCCLWIVQFHYFPARGDTSTGGIKSCAVCCYHCSMWFVCGISIGPFACALSCSVGSLVLLGCAPCWWFALLRSGCVGVGGRPS